jgi:hypothetical protein
MGSSVISLLDLNLFTLETANNSRITPKIQENRNNSLKLFRNQNKI